MIQPTEMPPEPSLPTPAPESFRGGVAHSVAGVGDDADASLDPWCVVHVAGGETALFGFAWRHPVTGGLSWTLSSNIVGLDADAGRARTASGRIYALGERVNYETMLDEEARIAFALLALPAAGMNPEDLLVDDRRVATAWLLACKAARHLDLDPPPRERDAVCAFMREHGPRYVEARQRRIAA